MTDPLSRLRRFLRELKRRNVYKVAVAYVAVAFVAIQAADLLVPQTTLPGYADNLLIYLAVFGFPIALVMAWAFEITPEGMRRTPDQREDIGEDRGLPKQALNESQGPGAVAVLPFADMSTEEDQEYFCDGIAEEIIDALTQIQGLQVVSRSSAFAFKDDDQDVRLIGEKLGVDAVLEGSVRKAGDRLRITAQLVDVVDGYHLWSERYDRQLEDIFEIQEDIAEAIAQRMREEVVGEQEPPTVREHTSDLEAYHFYLRGRYAWNRRGEKLFEAKEHFEEAIRRDSDYALAYAGVADCYNLLGWYGFLSPEESYPGAKARASEALEIDESLAEAQTSLGFAKTCYDWDWSAAEEHFDRAIELNPGYPTARHWYSEYLMAVGRLEDAIQEAQRAQSLDPLGLIINTVVGMALFFSRRYSDAAKELERVLDMDPDFVPAYVWAGLCAVQRDRPTQAVRLFQRGCELTEDRPDIVALLGYSLAADGETRGSQRILDELEEMSRRRYVSPFYLVRIFLALGRKDAAMEAIEEAHAERSTWLVWCNVDPTLDPLRSDARFQSIVRQMNFPDD